ncbi:MAG: LPXTG cell wall anchor domain-containing protein [Acidimicrobiales bacterium]
MSARPRARRRTAAATALALLGGIATLVTTDADRALAVVEHRSGFDATVLGWTSWYGSYGLGDQGLGWCIDHGLLAPDAAYGYVPVAPPMDERTGAAVSWVVATGELADRTGAAAIMLVLHDLMGATYPFGRLDVDALGPANLGGFGGAEAAVLDRARALKRWGWRTPTCAARTASTSTPTPSLPAWRERCGALVDRDGRPIGGVVVALAASGHLQDRTVVTDDAGRFRTTAQAIEGPNAFLARATLPSPTPRILAPTRAAAQRIAQPSFADAMGGTAFSLPPSTTTTRPPTTSTPTTSTPTTSTVPSTTSTTVPPSTTSTVPNSTTSTTVPPSTTSSVPSTTTSTVPTSSVPPGDSSPPAIALPPPAAPQLPVTGSSSAPLALIGLGLVISGGAVVSTARRRDGRWRRRPTV